MELGRYGVTVNAIAPGRPHPHDREAGALGPATFEPRRVRPLDPDNIAPLVVWLGSPESAGITGRVFNVHGGHISVAEGWHDGPVADKGDRWDPAELGAVVPDLVAQAGAPTVLAGRKASMQELQGGQS